MMKPPSVVVVSCGLVATTITAAAAVLLVITVTAALTTSHYWREKVGFFPLASSSSINSHHSQNREGEGGGRRGHGRRQQQPREDNSRLLGDSAGGDAGPGLDITSEVGSPISNGCADFDLSGLVRGRACGGPLAEPCFSLDRCLPPPDGPGPTLYVYDLDCSLADSSDMSTVAEGVDEKHVASTWRGAAKDAGVLAETYESACAFVYVNSRADMDPCVTRAPLWNGGVNNLVVDYTDHPRTDRPAITDSMAMEAASNTHTCYYRRGFDMSVPLYPRETYLELEPIPPEEREFFLTVKGSVYLSGTGSEERMSVVPLQDEANGVVSSMHCFELHHEHLLQDNVAYCEALKARYDDHEYGDLMNTTFSLVPSGRSPGTYRLGEVMSAGAIPVFVGRDLVRPFDEEFDWDKFSFVFTPDEVGPGLIETLRAVPPEQLKEMQRESLHAYWEIFKGTSNNFEVIARHIVDELVRRIKSPQK